MSSHLNTLRSRSAPPARNIPPPATHGHPPLRSRPSSTRRRAARRHCRGRQPRGHCRHPARQVVGTLHTSQPRHVAPAAPHPQRGSHCGRLPGFREPRSTRRRERLGVGPAAGPGGGAARRCGNQPPRTVPFGSRVGQPRQLTCQRGTQRPRQVAPTAFLVLQHQFTRDTTVGGQRIGGRRRQQRRGLPLRLTQGTATHRATGARATTTTRATGREHGLQHRVDRGTG